MAGFYRFASLQTLTIQMRKVRIRIAAFSVQSIEIGKGIAEVERKPSACGEGDRLADQRLQSRRRTGAQNIFIQQLAQATEFGTRRPKFQGDRFILQVMILHTQLTDFPQLALYRTDYIIEKILALNGSGFPVSLIQPVQKLFEHSGRISNGVSHRVTLLVVPPINSGRIAVWMSIGNFPEVSGNRVTHESELSARQDRFYPQQCFSNSRTGWCVTQTLLSELFSLLRHCQLQVALRQNQI